MTANPSRLDRPALSRTRLAAAVEGGSWRRIEVVERTASTNADVAAALKSGDGDGLVVIADEQVGGRGRLGRSWSAPPRAAVLLSVGLVPHPPADSWSLLPLLAGVAAAEALERACRVEPRLKWPNDLVLTGRKLGGILTERITRPGGAAAVVIGIGINVSLTAAELPVPTATSVAVAGGVTDREALVTEVLRGLELHLSEWSDTAGAAAAVLPGYRAICDTIGSDVVLDLPDGGRHRGVAVDVDPAGRLVVEDGSGERRSFSAGDVTHLRPGAATGGDDAAHPFAG